MKNSEVIQKWSKIIEGNLGGKQMKIIRNIKVPTGNILIVENEAGKKLECVSLGDYGAQNNLKADFLGLTQDIVKVKSQPVMPLTDKWVVTISTQFGCNSNCVFCDVPKVGNGVNASYDDMLQQIKLGLSIHPEITKTNRLNIHYARMGEPTWNPEVLKLSRKLHEELFSIIGNSLIHPVISTMCPNKNKKLKNFLDDWMDIKNNLYDGNAGLQLSINSTDDYERNVMFSGNCLSLVEISEMCKGYRPKGRKITLNFAVADYEINASRLAQLFNPEFFVVKLTPMHKTHTAVEHGIKTDGDYTTFYPYKEIEESLKKAGFDVLVFITSDDEDLGRITCGNAILSGTNPLCNYKDII